MPPATCMIDPLASSESVSRPKSILLTVKRLFSLVRFRSSVCLHLTIKLIMLALLVRRCFVAIRIRAVGSFVPGPLCRVAVFVHVCQCCRMLSMVVCLPRLPSPGLLVTAWSKVRRRS
ncbi:hypothetical protein BD309DRAFT_951065 [Dichomitus squalens]|nr:hypothetical protein BD309DRAFT_951065 [Dichomitus squalens]